MYIALCSLTGLYVKDNASECFLRKLSVIVQKLSLRQLLPVSIYSLSFLQDRLYFVAINGFWGYRTSYIHAFACFREYMCYSYHMEWVLPHAICQCKDGFPCHKTYIMYKTVGLEQVSIPFMQVRE